MQTKSINTPTILIDTLASKKNTFYISEVLNSTYINSKRFVLKKENQKKAIKIISKISYSIVLSGCAFKLIPLISPKFSKVISSKIASSFPTIIEAIGLIPIKKIEKINSRVYLFSSITSSVLGKDPANKVTKS